MTITYPVKNNLYINITNRCPCSCTFCLRNNGESVFGSGNLWLEHEPTYEEICQSIDSFELNNYNEIVFCGYGEPTERLDILLETAKYIKAKSDIKIRLNTNGLSDLIYNEKTAYKFETLIDTISISLNATNKDNYFKLVRPKFGICSYDSMLNFAKDCKKYIPNVVMTIVDVVTSKEEQVKCKQICDNLGVKLRIRPFEN